MKSQRGFSTVEALILLVILSIVGFGGWRVYSSRNNKEGSADKNTSTQQHCDMTTPDAEATELRYITYPSLSLAFPCNWSFGGDFAGPPEEVGRKDSILGSLSYVTRDVDLLLEGKPHYGLSEIQITVEEQKITATDNYKQYCTFAGGVQTEGYDCSVTDIIPLNNPYIPNAKLVFVKTTSKSGYSDVMAYFTTTDTAVGSTDFETSFTMNGKAANVRVNFSCIISESNNERKGCQLENVTSFQKRSLASYGKLVSFLEYIKLL